MRALQALSGTRERWPARSPASGRVHKRRVAYTACGSAEGMLVRQRTQQPHDISIGQRHLPKERLPWAQKVICQRAGRYAPLPPGRRCRKPPLAGLHRHDTLPGARMPPTAPANHEACQTLHHSCWVATQRPPSLQPRDRALRYRGQCSCGLTLCTTSTISRADSTAGRWRLPCSNSLCDAVTHVEPCSGQQQAGELGVCMPGMALRRSADKACCHSVRVLHAAPQA